MEISNMVEYHNNYAFPTYIYYNWKIKFEIKVMVSAYNALEKEIEMKMIEEKKLLYRDPWHVSSVVDSIYDIHLFLSFFSAPTFYFYYFQLESSIFPKTHKNFLHVK